MRRLIILFSLAFLSTQPGNTKNGAEMMDGLDYKIVQNAGGIQVGEPFRSKDNVVWLPVTCNIAGTQTITVSPTRKNSALAVRRIRTKLKGNQIYLTVKTSLATKKLSSHFSSPVRLGKIRPGKYVVSYGRNLEGTDFPVLSNIQVP